MLSPDRDNIRQYKRDLYSKNPFAKPAQPHKNQKIDQGRPGSDWGLAQIQWLGVKLEWTCPISQVLGSESELKPDSRLRSLITDAMNRPWEEFVNDKDLDERSLNARLASLARIHKPLNDYDRSSTIEAPSSPPASQGRDALSPFSSPQQNQERDISSQHVRSSPVVSIPAPITPRPKQQSPSSSPLSSPPEIIQTPTPRPHQQTGKSTSVPSPTPHGKGKAGIKRIADGLLRGPEDDQVPGDADSGSENALDEDTQGKGKRVLYSALPSSSIGVSKVQLQAEYKPEVDVQYVARDFLGELSDHFR